MPIINIVFIILYIIILLSFFFACYVLINRAWKLKVFWLTIIFWLIPIYPIIFLVTNTYPTYGETCGIFGCEGAMIGALMGLAWFIIYVIVGAIILNLKLENKQSSISDQNPAINSKHYYLEYSIGIFVILCFVVWLVVFR